MTLGSTTLTVTESDGTKRAVTITEDVDERGALVTAEIDDEEWEKLVEERDKLADVLEQTALDVCDRDEVIVRLRGALEATFDDPGLCRAEMIHRLVERGYLTGPSDCRWWSWKAAPVDGEGGGNG